MAKIPLRAYNREIESYIEQGRTDEAIAHCRHILKFHSKHLDTYRLLGKAFLESQRYSEAADILQRVLSAVPDDFISQIGMSIIREDEGNLDAAIYHMERAYEIQPSNTAIQEELRRLFGRRDGVEPPKVRLTRGALVRLYARGELYPQAIAEIRAALAENPNRVDLEVILARMNYLSGQKVEAAEVCSRLVSKLPYCFEANRILAEVLPGTSRADDARIYQQRVYALDPYLEYVTQTSPLPTDVPDHAVLVERLEYDPDAIEVPQAGWTQTLGVEWEEAEEQLPEWLVAEEPTEAGSEELSGQALEAAIKEPQPLEDEPAGEEAVIPDFLASAGWTKSDGVETPPEPIEEFDETETDIAPAEIPEWLQSMAPEMDAESSEEDEEAISWLEDILPAGEAEGESIEISDLELPEELKSIDELFAEDAVESGEQPEQPAEFEEALTGEGLPVELISEFDAGESKEEAEEGELPEWLTGLDLGETESKTEDTTPEWLAAAETADEEAAESEPDWLASLTVDGEQSEEFKVEAVESAEDEMPDWLKSAAMPPEEAEAQPAQSTFSVDETVLEEAADEFADVQPEHIGDDGSAPAAGVETPPLADLDETMAWLEGLAAKHGADEETLITPPDERSETPPEWIAALQEQTDETEETKFESIASEWKPEITEVEEPAEQAVDLPVEESDAMAEAIASEESEPLFTEESAQPEAAEAEEIPDWLAEALSDEGAEEPAAEAEEAGWKAEIETPPAVTKVEIESIASALEERMSDEEPGLKLEESLSEGPLSEEVFESELPEVPAERMLDDQVEQSAADAGEEIPEWLQDLVDEDLTTELTEAKALDEMPEWLEKIDGPERAEVQPVTAEAVEQPITTEELSASPAPVEAPAAVEPQSAGDWEAVLADAQADLAKEQIDSAIQRYTMLVQSGNCLDQTIQDIREALYRYPVDVALWQLLGDAYARNNMLQDALDAYTKAEELLR